MRIGYGGFTIVELYWGVMVIRLYYSTDYPGLGTRLGFSVWAFTVEI